MTKRALTILACLLCTPSVIAGESRLNQLTAAESRSGWALLFDGKTTSGWRNFRSKTVSDGWKVRDGAITRTGRAGDIMTDKQYRHFELQLEYRISKGGNSGLMFHVTEDENTPWKTGPEIQIQDNVDGHDPQKAGWLYQLYRPRRARDKDGKVAPEDATRPAGEWNHLYLRIEPNVCEVCLNGFSYFKFRKGSKDWDARVAKSKFARFEKFGKAEQGHICLQDHGNEVAFRNVKIRVLSDGEGPPNPVDGALDLKRVPAFPELSWEGWTPVTEEGRTDPLRPLVLTNAGDRTGRLFSATQDGMIHVFENDPAVKTTRLFLDLRKQVKHWRKPGANEEGLLGLAFHPQFEKNGLFYVYYTSAHDRLTSIISEFKVGEDPDRADPESERVLLKIKQPYTNHNGGSMEFGPDGYLYIGMGDGGARNDPVQSGQNLNMLLGKILRIDVNKRDIAGSYGVPDDNPYVGKKNARPEVYAYGFRNVWRLHFDRDSGRLWAADVGQDLWEEINVVQRGGNYGWSHREASRLFGRIPESTNDLIDPIWEYDHQIGKSITGGMVCTGKAVPALTGKYLYADYVSSRIWAMQYDPLSKRVIRNLAVTDGTKPGEARATVLAFGQDEAGDVYYMVEALNGGRVIYRFEK